MFLFSPFFCWLVLLDTAAENEAVMLGLGDYDTPELVAVSAEVVVSTVETFDTHQLQGKHFAELYGVHL